MHGSNDTGETLVLLLFAVVVVEGVGADESGRRGEDSPFIAVGVVAGLADGVVGDDVDDEVLGAVVEELMGFTGLEDKSVAGFDGCGAVLIAPLPEITW